MVFWPEWGGKDADALQVQVDKWAANTGTTVEFLPIRDHTRMIASMSAGNPPDLLMTWDANAVGQWGFEGVLRDIQPYIDQAGMDLSMYFPIGVASGNLMGIKQIGLPLTNYITTILYWNKDTFAAAGLDAEKAPETWEELEELANKLTVVENGQIKKMGYSPLVGQVSHPTVYAYAYGGSIWSEDRRTVTPEDPANIESLKFCRRFYEKYTTEEMERWDSSLGTEADAPTYPIYTGELAMEVLGEWMPTYFDQVKELNLNISGAYLPHPASKPEVKGTMGANTNPLVIPTNAKNPDAAFDFIRFISEPENSAEMCVIVGNASPVVEGLKLQIAKTTQPLYKEILEQIWAQGQIKPMTINSPIGSLYNDTYARYRDEVVQDGADPEERMLALKDEIQAELDAALDKLGI
ncbi:MAG: glycerol-3-phosphate transporter periplasmic binding protein [Chloroflexi bacterium ADurb.Bin325]|nr:MAG: glycerol-3-phosphate transporter periplasmic binding protein [Chloroflexi bacterium ADurb.Bin325]